MGQAITIWVDESTELNIDGDEYNLVGYLITNSDEEEFSFLNALKQARKVAPVCWTTLHGSEINPQNTRELPLLDRWLNIFKQNDSIFFHAFLYRRNGAFIARNQTYEHYFAKQSVFALANKMRRRDGYVVNSMFKDVSTLTVLFDRRRSHTADVVARDGGGAQIDRLHDLENIYKAEIANQISHIAGRNTATNDLTVRFSFLSSECFDAMQFSDCFLYLLRQKIEQETSGVANDFTALFDKYFMDNLDQHTRDIGFRKIYEFDKKLNFFESRI